MSAVISSCGTYRYRLGRTWDAEAPELAWIMLNPSTADAVQDDATIRRCIGFAKAWGYGGIVVVNLFALRARNPRRLTEHSDPIGPENDGHIDGATRHLTTIAAWGGSIPDYWRHRGRSVAGRLMNDGVALFHLGLTKGGHPRHPLYLPGAATPTRWTGCYDDPITERPQP